MLACVVLFAAAAACAPSVELHATRHLAEPVTAKMPAPGISRVLMLPPRDQCPSTGGERNMDFFTQGLHRLAYDVHVFVTTGPLERHYRAMGIAVAEPVDLRLLGRNATHFEMVAQAATARVSEALHCATDGTCTADESLQPLVPLLAQLDAMLLPTTLAKPSEETVSLTELDVPAALQQALQLRHAAQSTDADVVFADLSKDAAAAVIGLAGTRHRILWYPQMTESEKTDAFLALHTAVVTCGEGVRQHRFGDSAHAVAVPNGVDVQRFLPITTPASRPELLQHGGDDALIVGNVASIDGRKNQKLLIQAVGEKQQELGLVHLYFFGDAYDSAYQQSLLALAEQVGVADRVHFVGSHANIEDYIRHFDIFVLPSLAEGMSLSLLEAMSSQVACLASDIPGTQEMAGDGVAYFTPDDARTLGDKLVALAQQPEARHRMGVAARATVISRGFTKESMLRHMAEQVSRVAAQSGDLRRQATHVL